MLLLGFLKGALVGSDPQDAALRWLLDDQRARSSADELARVRRLREQAAEDSTMAGTLLDLAESGQAVGVRTVTGQRHQGVVAGLGRDFCLLRPAHGRSMYVTLAAIASVRVAAGARAGDPGTRAPAVDRTLREVLAFIVPERPRVTLRTVGDSAPVTGELRAVGVDLATVRLDGPEQGTCYLPLDALAEVAFDVG